MWHNTLFLLSMAHAMSVFAQMQLPPVIHHGHSYPVVLIGDQWWFAENLRTE